MAAALSACSIVEYWLKLKRTHSDAICLSYLIACGTWDGSMGPDKQAGCVDAVI